ncbi:hypothetical protein Micbo1qcDRAFT_207708 [Microdochium bolleyi]|uniref:Zn(2)-C6 fungal-type domain-containing protein n=1 Tax=Microdochium bolleyi TaxID=196109 RepID=A0A136IT00_9PEZI|nr:hypothetical protein Micbo1qcDRAFT_207708 [Microdochium bolleyi]
MDLVFQLSVGSNDNTTTARREKTSRSRNGCQTCRQRHIRCDETQPSWYAILSGYFSLAFSPSPSDVRGLWAVDGVGTACVKSRRSCAYRTPAIPLRDRRQGYTQLLPGYLKPWAVSEVASLAASRTLSHGAAVDPFDTLSCRMPYNSKQLLYYFHHAGSMLADVKRLGLQDCLKLASPQPHALRNALLVAITHYIWTTGDVETYKSAALFHKVQSIHTINEDLRDTGVVDQIHGVRLICTLAIFEACQGNMPTAQTHINGLMAALEIKSPDTWSLEQELTERYIMLAYYFFTNLQQKVRDAAAAEERQRGLRPRPPSASRAPRGAGSLQPRHTPPSADARDRCEKDTLGIIQRGHVAEQDGLRKRLETLRMVPYFFTPVPPHVTRLAAIDAAPFITALGRMTRDVDAVKASPEASRNNNMLWDAGSVTEVWCKMITAHVQSLSGEKCPEGSPPPPPPPPLSSSSSSREVRAHWVATSAAFGVYMYCVLGISEWDPRILCRLAADIGEEAYNVIAVTPAGTGTWKAPSTPPSSRATNKDSDEQLSSSYGSSYTSSSHGSPGARTSSSTSSRASSTVPLDKSSLPERECACQVGGSTQTQTERDLQFWIAFMGAVALITYTGAEYDWHWFEGRSMLTS